jgi:hypothetical protein
VGMLTDGGSRVWPSFGSGSRVIASPGGGSRACPSSSSGSRVGMTESRDNDGDNVQIHLVVVATCDGVNGLMDGVNGHVHKFFFFCFSCLIYGRGKSNCLHMSQIKP